MKLSHALLSLLALSAARAWAREGVEQVACAEDEIEAAELEEAEAMKTELLQVKVSSEGTIGDAQERPMGRPDEHTSVVIDDMGDMPTMLVQTDVEVSSKSS
eukprot:TRINITY_DN1548_c0_g1_i1.p1 TRINITY_DN1548_c0_g1~~TRINITY_DN1548_c0_g1_i1.p1  ORF type:complete len:102 (+),score=34.56 TRINITY_DN1548_c0_g1_i1:95-400(+)